MPKFKSYLIQNGIIDNVQFLGGVSEDITDEAQLLALRASRFAEEIEDSTKAVEQAEIDVAEFNLPDPDEKPVEQMTYNELKSICHRVGLATTGKTTDLLSRIQASKVVDEAPTTVETVVDEVK